MNIDSVPKMTTVDTATAVLCGSPLTTGSAPSTAAAPQIALPVAVSSERSRSIFNSRPTSKPKKIVAVTMMPSISKAGKPMATTLWNVSRKPYRMMPARRICLVQNCMPGTQVAGRRLRRLLAYSIPSMMPTMSGLNESRLTNSNSAI